MLAQPRHRVQPAGSGGSARTGLFSEPHAAHQLHQPEHHAAL